MLRRTKILALFTAAAPMSLAAPAATASSPITWGSAFEVQSDDDVSLSGRQIVYAVNGGDNVGNPTYTSAPQGTAKNVVIGGVTIPFQGLNVTYGSKSTFGSNTYGDVSGVQGGVPVTLTADSERGTVHPQADWDYGSTPALGTSATYTANTGDAALDSVLASQVWSDARTANSAGSALVVTMGGLTPGTTYQVQVIGPGDGRVPDSGKVDNSANVDFVTDNLGHLGQGLAADADVNGDGIAHVTSLLGTFTADATEAETFDIELTAGRNPGFSAMILTAAAPEPTSAVTVGAATAALLGGRRRRRSAR